MKNGNMDDRLKMQEQELKEPKQYFTGENKKEIYQFDEKENIISCNLDNKQNNEQSFNQANNTGDSLLSIFSLGDSNNYDAISAEESQAKKLKKKKKKGIRR